MAGIIQAIICFKTTLLCWLERFLLFIKDLVLWTPRKTFEIFTDEMAVWFPAHIQAPAFLNDLTTYLGSLTGFLGYLLELFQVNVGLGYILGAYLIRFFIRRLPIVG